MTGVLVCATIASTHAQPRPLPDRDTLFRDVRRQLRDDRRVMAEYTRRETIRKTKFDAGRRVVQHEVRVVEVFPSVEDDLTYRRLVSENGVPVPADQLQKEDRQHLRKVQQRARRLQGAGTNGDDLGRRRNAEARREEEELLSELFALFDFTILRREVHAGVPAIIVGFEPKRGVRGQSDLAKWLQRMKGRAWIHETEHEVLRVEAEVTETISWGWFIARLDPGSTMSFTRTRLADGTWLPARISFSGSGRILLVKRFRQESVTEFGDYRRITGGALTSFEPPRNARP